MEHLEPGLGQQVARRITRGMQALLSRAIATEIHWSGATAASPDTKKETAM
jgi:hypothetical protein